MNKKLFGFYVLLAVGLLYGFAPHSLHTRLHIDFGATHQAHQIIGISTIVIGLIYYFTVVK